MEILASDPKLLPTTGSLKFWRPQDIAPLDFVIPIIRGEDRDQRGDWPGGNFPSWSEIKTELSTSRSSYLTIKPLDDRTGYFINILIGRYMILTRCKRGKDGKGNLRINLNSKGIKFANNNQRRNMVVQGVRVEHRGIALISFEKFYADFVDRNNLYALDEYAKIIIALESRQSPEVIHSCEPDDAEDEPIAPLQETEEHLLHTLETYVDAEHFLEEQKARTDPGFSYIEAVPEMRDSSVRQYFRFKLLESDYKRLKALAPRMLVLESGEDEHPLQFQVENLEPNGGKYQIVVSSGKQLFTGAIPESGRFILSVNPIQKNVRIKVIENLRQRLSPNKWLLPLTAKSYQHHQVPSVTVPVPIPPPKFPPNPSQVNAINLGAGTEDYLLVLGPPGTGKTTVILRWVDYFVSQGKRILISSQNNKAVDNVLERLAENRKLTCVRLGDEGKVSSSVHDLLIDNSASGLQKKLIESLDINIAHLNEFERICNETINAGKSPSVSVEHIINWLTQIDTYLSERLVTLSKVFERAHSFGDIFSTTMLGELQERIHHLRLSHERYLEKGGLLKLLFRIAAWWYRWRIHKAIKKIDVLRDDKLSKLTEIHKTTENLIAEISAWHKTLANQRQEGLYPILLNFVDVVGATCIGINTNKFFKDAAFDVVIVDESGQIQLHNLAVPLSRAPKGILVGDHKQLPPVVNEELIEEVNERADADSIDIDTELLKKSWFESLWDSAPDDRKAMLDTQFRCPAVISDYISSAFYEDKYFAGPGMAEKQPLFTFFKSPLVFIDTSSLPMGKRQESSRQGPERDELIGNQVETQIVLSLLERALAASPQLGERREIGVIVPYKLHVQEIQREISARQRKGELLQLPAPISELVASVDSYQGQERDLIIFTFTRSNPNGTVGFLSDWRRLNVAMTRAKRQLVMVGDFSTLARQSKPGRRDAEFKSAMIQLRSFVMKNGHLIEASEWLPKAESTSRV